MEEIDYFEKRQKTFENFQRWKSEKYKKKLQKDKMVYVGLTWDNVKGAPAIGYECSICGWRTINEFCSNPKCGKEVKLTWQK